MSLYTLATCVSQWFNCCDYRPFDELTWSVEALLRLPKSWMERGLQYKYYVHAGKGIDQNYERITQTNWGEPRNRCLISDKSYSYDARSKFQTIIS